MWKNDIWKFHSNFLLSCFVDLFIMCWCTASEKIDPQVQTSIHTLTKQRIYIRAIVSKRQCITSSAAGPLKSKYLLRFHQYRTAEPKLNSANINHRFIRKGTAALSTGAPHSQPKSRMRVSEKERRCWLSFWMHVGVCTCVFTCEIHNYSLQQYNPSP